jgi:hypothetical protein
MGERRSFLPLVEELLGVVVKYWTVAVVGWLVLFELVMLKRLGICCCCCCFDETCWRSNCWLASWF